MEQGGLIAHLFEHPPEPAQSRPEFGRAVAYGDRTAAQISAQRFGESVDGAGDFDGDGFADVIAGAPFATVIPGGMFGWVDVLSASGTTIANFAGGHPRDHLGTAVAGLGDFDGDGWDDVALGSPNQLVGALGVRPGRVRIVFGEPPNGEPPSWSERRFWTLDPGTRWGATVAAAGDVNGDGLGDVSAGEPYGEDGGQAYVFTAGPGPDPFAGRARLTAYIPAIEAHDVDGYGYGGGRRSPATTSFTLDAGPAWAGADYAVIGIPDVGSYLQPRLGTLDGVGMTTAPLFGPIESSILCGAIGYRFGFLGAALKDLDDDGSWDTFLLSNPATVEIINEEPPPCR